ncbi:MAG: NADH-quinone oxidoreductase subunit L [Acidobacteriota bacterium]|nr:NADH-quinone oxidoreductase subunit L [Acidobacteriota bacterium]MDE3030292.1 NADH-quinone oxidoreductase subunit L [Acidobacteriota bacterium]MDE3093617.1 NADH-quinone oxidoreductase subunit L [Acidobacteriota bacterium]MDE3145957.1 NADH-quinone oxidoreductase subunit L [Acidobacteriota bacterium]
MSHLAPLILVLPLLGFLLVVLNGKSLSDRGVGLIATGVVALSFVVTVITFVLLLHDRTREVTINLFTWISVDTLHVPAAILVDPLSITMSLFVTGISALIHLYSTAYMEGEKDFRKFFLYLNLFVFSMLTLVLANNLVLTFVGWEGVGVCSYWLVSFYFDRESAASAGKKAFVYNRVGDIGLLLAMFLLFVHTHTLTYLGIFSSTSLLSPAIATLVVLALLLAATGKSAQIPLFNWLPDAMEGPTPVSALIHAATMVTAGVYLLVRMSPVLALSSSGRMTIAVIGGVTAFVAATIATAQKDIKKVLAFSTVSQIGYMVLAVGVGAYGAAIFLMVSHAFFKALLFLGSGSVIHSLGGEQDMRKMGGLARWLPLTFPTFLVGWLSISGVPPFSGFWAKGDVLSNVFAHNKPLWALGVVTAILTAYYMSRLFMLTFRGSERFREVTHQHDPHESPLAMTAPLVILATLSLLGGLLDLPWAHGFSLTRFLSPTFGFVAPSAAQSTTLQTGLALVDVVAALIGLFAAFTIWRTNVESSTFERPFFEHVWRWDDAYDAVLARPLEHLAQVSNDVVENRIIDGAVEGLGGSVQRSGEGIRKLQAGLVRQYALAMVLGVTVIVVYLVGRVR